MIQLNEQQKNALWMLQNAIEELDHVLMANNELCQVLDDLGFLPERDLTEMSAELEFCVKRGQIGTREDLLKLSNSEDPNKT
ncbi:hypothetical protein [Paenibacillus glucanolyticus]|uniref:hypothetical protein n=1 Tax=Paenibacillus glucanolyticus TaxID=59843 RepID=UPI00096C4F07|nr:hypothetical protein [Paenibacillus glucanolyticus]OMF76729.1 hypothetical protein BK142_14510 [Paenibacillus glucanolyticus]